MSEAVQALTNTAFEIGFNRVEIHCAPENLRSASLPRALGFRFEARLAEHTIDHQNCPRDSLVFARLKSQGSVAPAQRKPFPRLVTPHLILRLANLDDISEIVKYYRENEAHLQPFNPAIPESFYTEQFWRTKIPQFAADFVADKAVRLYMFHLEDDRKVIGSLEFSQIARGPFQACCLGYGIAREHQGKGLMFEAAHAAIQYAFRDLNIHRIMANHLPENERSANLLARLGFQKECVAKDYLQVNGKWQDHVLNSLSNPEWKNGL